MSIHPPRAARRGAVRAGFLTLPILAAAAILAGVPAPRADTGMPVAYRRIVEPTVVPEVVNVREMMRRMSPAALMKGAGVRRVTPDHRRSPRTGEVGSTPETLAPAGSRGPAPAPIRSFNTVPDTGSLPPDDGLAVGPNHLVSAANVSWGVYDKNSGQQRFLVSFLSWYQGLDNTNNIFDPRVDYDADAGRYYLVTVGMDAVNNRSMLHISVSQTADPLGNWFKYAFDVKESNPDAWLDFPSFGYNNQALFVTGNVFQFNPSQFRHVTMRIFDKGRMLSGAAITPTTLVMPAGIQAFTVQPATSHDQSNVEWMTETVPIGTGTSTVLRLWKVTNALAASPTIVTTVLTVPAYSGPPAMAQSGSTVTLDGGDGRVANAVLRNGQLWTTHGVGETIGGATRGTARVYQLGTAGNGSLVNTYTLSDPTLNLHYPSLDVDVFGAVLVGFTSAAPSIFPSIHYAVKGPADTAFSDLGLLRAGTTLYDPTPLNRWGDYSDCAFDPAAPNVIWHQNELAVNTTTWVKHVGAIQTTPQSIQVTAPNGGEILLRGSTFKIRWNQVGFVPAGDVRIELSRDSGRTYLPADLIASSTPNDGEFDWTVPGPVAATCRVRVTSLIDTRFSDAGDGDFRIVDGSLNVTAPNGGEILRTGSVIPIQWVPQDFAATIPGVLIELSRNGGGTWEVLFASAANSGSQNWTVTGPTTPNALVRVSTLSVPPFTDTSNATFEIREPSRITVTSPNGGERFVPGDVAPITWQSAGFNGNVRIELSRNAGVDYETLFPDAPNSGTASYTVTGPLTRLGRVRITSIEEPAVSDVSNGLFEVERRTIQVTGPGEGQVLLTGQTGTVTFATTGIPAGDNVRLELSRDGGLNFVDLAVSTPNDGAESFAVSGPATLNAIVRVSWVNDPSLFALSPTFTIDEPTLFLVSPRGGERVRLGDQQLIQWSGTTVGFGTATIELSRDGGRTWVVAAAGVANDGAHRIGVRGPTSRKARVRIRWNQGAVTDESPRNFQILPQTRSRRR